MLEMLATQLRRSEFGRRVSQFRPELNLSSWYWQFSCAFGILFAFFNYDALYTVQRGFFDVVYLPARLLGILLVVSGMVDLLFPSKTNGTGEIQTKTQI